jgi:hypothetical protein
VGFSAVEPDLGGGHHLGELGAITRLGLGEDVGHRGAGQNHSAGAGGGAGGGEQPEDSHGESNATGTTADTPFPDAFGRSLRDRYLERR